MGFDVATFNNIHRSFFVLIGIIFLVSLMPSPVVTVASGIGKGQFLARDHRLLICEVVLSGCAVRWVSDGMVQAVKGKLSAQTMMMWPSYRDCERTAWRKLALTQP